MTVPLVPSSAFCKFEVLYQAERASPFPTHLRALVGSVWHLVFFTWNCYNIFENTERTNAFMQLIVSRKPCLLLEAAELVFAQFNHIPAETVVIPGEYCLSLIHI